MQKDGQLNHKVQNHKPDTHLRSCQVYSLKQQIHKKQEQHKQQKSMEIALLSDKFSYNTDYQIIMVICKIYSQHLQGIWNNDKLVGVFLQIDILDYSKISKICGHQKLYSLFSIGYFDQYIQKLSQKSKKGDFILTLYSLLIMPDGNMYRKQINLIFKGLYYCKIGGWRNILFQTYNPIPFLKINGKVIQDSHELNRNAQMLQLLENPQGNQKIQLVLSNQQSQQAKMNANNQKVNKDQLLNFQIQKFKQAQKSYLIKINLQQLSINQRYFYKFQPKL